MPANNQSNVPTVEEIKTLPRWAIIAFAARCARRVEPLFPEAWPNAPSDHIDAVRAAVEFAERVASTGVADITRAKYYAQIADIVSDEADYGADAHPESGAYFAAHAAANAAGAIAHTDEAATAAHFAAQDASTALSAISHERNDSIRRDFSVLRRLATEERWNDNTPVSPHIFSLHSIFDLTADSNTDENAAAKLEAYYAWEQAGRPLLSIEDQDQMYYDALRRVRRNTT
jgi:hypothetical protein